MNNKPTYSLFKNAKYALDGLAHAFKSETSFKIELFLIPFVLIAIYLMPFSFSSKMILFVTLIFVPIVELLNSAVENVVDMVTQEFHPLAKAAKDIGATAVLFALLLHLGCWVLIIINEFK